MVLKKVSVDRIEGKPFVLHLDTLCKKAFADWLDYDDHFVCDRYVSPAMIILNNSLNFFFKFHRFCVLQTVLEA